LRTGRQYDVLSCIKKLILSKQTFRNFYFCLCWIFLVYSCHAFQVQESRNLLTQFFLWHSQCCYRKETLHWSTIHSFFKLETEDSLLIVHSHRKEYFLHDPLPMKPISRFCFQTARALLQLMVFVHLRCL